MSKVTMPEPLIEGSKYHPELKIMYRGMVHFTAEQMESYAAAKVREALEEAAKAAESCVCSCCCSDDQKFTAQDAAQRIRALIPSTPA